MNYAQMKESVMEMVSHHFRPEFINRIDEVVVFHPLGEKHIAAIAKIQLSRLYKRLEERGYEVTMTEPATGAVEQNRLRPCVWCASVETRYSAGDREPAGAANPVR